jgi:hypothetical protein
MLNVQRAALTKAKAFGLLSHFVGIGQAMLDGHLQIELSKRRQRIIAIVRSERAAAERRAIAPAVGVIHPAAQVNKPNKPVTLNAFTIIIRAPHNAPPRLR